MFVDMKNREYILCSAVWFPNLPLINTEVLEPRGYRPIGCPTGVVFSGHRHHNCLYQMVAVTGLTDHQAGHGIQGFLTNLNRFVEREEAFNIAMAANQIIDLNNARGKKLYSEDLY